MGRNKTIPIGLREDVFRWWEKRREVKRQELGINRLSWSEYFGKLKSEIEAPPKSPGARRNG